MALAHWLRPGPRLTLWGSARTPPDPLGAGADPARPPGGRSAGTEQCRTATVGTQEARTGSPRRKPRSTASSHGPGSRPDDAGCQGGGGGAGWRDISTRIYSRRIRTGDRGRPNVFPRWS
ncbi:hypothetical protein GCM10010331_03370 [Streptomyces xanthochromogenes]|nr:hypothetical protein GCM10010331_03370 [Streptomyces xanthochromogenes]